MRVKTPWQKSTAVHPQLSANLHAPQRARCPLRRSTVALALANCDEDRPVPTQMAAVCAAVSLLCGTGSAWAGEKVGEFAASGFLFKDTVEVVALEDPDVSGVTIYISDFKRSIVDKLAKDFFSEPSQASVTCAITGPVVIKDTRNVEGSEGREVFAEAKGLSIFKDKTTRIRRLYDPKRKSLVYVAYSTRLSSAKDEGNVSTGRYRTSICALSVPNKPAPAVAETTSESLVFAE